MVTGLRVAAARLRALVTGSRQDEDFDEELRTHLAMLTDDNVRRGMTADEARRAAAIRVGSTASLAAQHRDARGLPAVEAVIQDVTFALRLIARNPWFSAAAILTLALGIGINALGFTIVNGAFLRSVPFDQPDELQMLSWQTRAGRRDEVSLADLQDWRSASRTFAGLAAFNPAAMHLSDDRSPPEQVRGAWVTANTFELLRQQPLLGRGFTPADEAPGADRVLLVSSRLWRDRYGSDPDLSRLPVRLNGEPAAIVGVMPDSLTFPDMTEVWAPYLPSAPDMRRDARVLSVLGRLQSGASMRGAQTELNAIGRRLTASYPAETPDYTGIRVETFNDAFVGGPARTVFLAMMGAVCFVLLIACANVANLLLSRSVQRSREIALRVAIGATRWRVVRQLLVESIVLGLLGGGLGLLITMAGSQSFDAAVQKVGRPFFMTFTVDYVVFAYVLVICVAAAALFGLAPALQISRANTADVLKEGGRGGAGGPRARRWSSALVVAELALTVILLAGAGLMVRSFFQVYSMNLGIDANQLLTMNIELAEPRYATVESRRTFLQRLETELAAVPGVNGLAVTTGVPPFDGGERLFEVEGRSPSGDRPFVSIVAAGSGFFDVAGAPLVRGRTFEPADGTPGREAAIVNTVLAERYFRGENPIGRRVRVTPRRPPAGAPDPSWLTVVGVAPAIRHGSIRDSEPNPVVYLSVTAEAPTSLSLLVRSQLPLASVGNAMRARVQALDPDQPVVAVQTIEQLLAESRWPFRAFAGMFALFGIVGLVLSAVGLYGVMACAVSQRTQEIGVRMAMGATRREVTWMVLRRGLRYLAVGLPLGLIGALALSGVLQRSLVAVGPGDPFTFAGITLLLTLVAAAACLVPARRATRIDPAVALRAE